MIDGFIYTPEDERDYPICMAYDEREAVELPKNYKTSFQPPYEKQVAGNCVAQSLANIMEVIWHKQTGAHEDFSIGFIYGNRNDDESKKEGMTGYLACGHLVKDGDIKAELFENPGSAPSIITAVNKFKAEHPEWKSKSYIPSAYIRTKKAKEAKKFILKYDIPVMAVCDIGDFYYGSGMHAMALYGWQGDTAIMQNSWGENHKFKIVEMPFEDIKEYWLIVPYNIIQFTDVPETFWGYENIRKCGMKGVMTGYVDGTFKPNENMTRAEFCTAIYRYMKGENKI